MFFSGAPPAGEKDGECQRGGAAVHGQPRCKCFGLRRAQSRVSTNTILSLYCVSPLGALGVCSLYRALCVPRPCGLQLSSLHWPGVHVTGSLRGIGKCVTSRIPSRVRALQQYNSAPGSATATLCTTVWLTAAGGRLPTGPNGAQSRSDRTSLWLSLSLSRPSGHLREDAEMPVQRRVCERDRARPGHPKAIEKQAEQETSHEFLLSVSFFRHLLLSSLSLSPFRYSLAGGSTHQCQRRSIASCHVDALSSAFSPIKKRMTYHILFSRSPSLPSLPFLLFSHVPLAPRPSTRVLQRSARTFPTTGCLTRRVTMTLAVRSMCVGCEVTVPTSCSRASRDIAGRIVCRKKRGTGREWCRGWKRGWSKRERGKGRGQ